MPVKSQGRFSVKGVMSEGIDNAGLQLHESYQSKQDAVGDIVNNSTSSTSLHENPGRRRRSLVQLTREALPRLENYRNSKRALKRPSLGELHEGNDFVKVSCLSLGDLNIQLFLYNTQPIIILALNSNYQKYYYLLRTNMSW